MRALSLDLDDTLWPVAPAIERAERHTYAWMQANCPKVTERYELEELLEMRQRVAEEHRDRAWDYSQLRRLLFARLMKEAGYGETLADDAFEVFYAARQQVELFPGTDQTLAKLATRFQLVSISNGNACLKTIGLAKHFTFSLHARDFGKPKPDPHMFEEAARRLDIAAEEILHIGDHPVADVEAARNAGFSAVWFNPKQHPWPNGNPTPPSIRRLEELLDF